MKRITAILLAMLMVSFCFATTVMADETTEDVTSEDVVTSGDATSDDATSDDATSDDATSDDAASEEPSIETILVSGGKKYTTTSDAENGLPSYQGVCNDGYGEGYYLTDGIVRDVEKLDSAGIADMDKSIEFAGTNRTHFVTIELGATKDVGLVVLGTVRRGNNRYTNIASIEVLVKGSWVKVDWEEKAVAIEGAGQYGDEKNGVAPYDQFFDVYAAFNPVDTSSIRIGIDTEDKTGAISHYGPRGYIAQLDEISVYSVILPDDGSDNGDDNNDDNTGDTTAPTGDLGLSVFAVLAVVSLAGVVVAKKVK